MSLGDLVDRRFRLVDKTGQGAFGTIYRAIDTVTARDVALKVLDREETDFARFEREAEVLATVRHPNVVAYVAHGQTDDGAPYLAMEWLEGVDLAQRLAREPLPVRDALAVATHAAQGLAAAHALGIVHRDVKPSNLFLLGGRSEDLRVIDFGIARVLPSFNKLTATGAVLGTPAYMSPEQARGARDVSPRADVFALGCVLFECLTGAPPFVGANPHALLANLLSGRTPRLSARRPDAPPVLDALLARMLAHDPADRFPDAGAVALAVSSMTSDGARVAPAIPLASRPPLAHSVVIVQAPAGGVLPDTVTPLVVSLGGELRLAEPAVILAAFEADAGAECAERAAHCAISVRDHARAARLAIVSGRGDMPVAHPSALDEQIDAAVVQTLPGLIVVDRATARLLSAHYDCRQDAGRITLEPRRGTSDRRRVRLVGRARELSTLEGTLAEVLEEHCARVALIAGEAGIGKTRLLEELLSRIADGEAATVLRAACDRPTSASPFAGVAQIVRERISAAGARRSPPSSRAPVDAGAVLREDGITPIDADFLAELSGEIPGDAPAHVAAARRDPMRMADAFRSAFLAFLEALLATGPLVLAIEDLHFADPATVRLLDAGVAEMANRPFLVVATARPDEAAAVLPIFDARDPERIVLRPLRAQAAAELARAVLPDAAPETVERVVARAAGNPLRVTEFARLGPDDPTPESALGAIEVRLARLDPSTSRMLRAASAFGLRFPLEGLCALLGGDGRRDDVLAHLGLAEDERFVARAPAGGGYGGDTWAFRHDLVREGAYATLTAEERRATHAAIAAWLEERAGADPSLVAWHFEHGGERSHAFRWYEAAARAALRGSDLDRAAKLTEEAMASDPSGDDRARVLLLRAETAFLAADAAGGRRASAEAMALATVGSTTWVSAAGLLVTTAGQRGENEEVARLANLLLAHRAEPAAAARRAVCLCRAATQMYSSGDHPLARALVAEVEASDIDDVEAQAWLSRLRALFQMFEHDYDAAIGAQTRAASLHAAAGDVRTACLARILLASLHVFAGDFEHASGELDVAERMARRTGAEYFLRWAAYTRGKILALSSDPATARAHLESVRRALAGNPRMIAGAHVYSAIAGLRAGDARWAEADARAALDAHAPPGVRAPAQALLARALARAGRAEEALGAARAAQDTLRSVGTIEENEALVHLAVVEALLASGREDEAREQARRALDRLVGIAGKLSTPARREAYLHGIEAHAETIRLALKLGLEPPG